MTIAYINLYQLFNLSCISMKEIQVTIKRSEKGFSVQVKKDGGPLSPRKFDSDLGKAIQNALFADKILWLSGNFAMWKNESVKITFHT